MRIGNQFLFQEKHIVSLIMNHHMLQSYILPLVQ